MTQRWATEVARLYEVVVVLEGRISMSGYFADMALKKQVVVSALFQCQIIVADCILVSFFLLTIFARRLTRGSRFTACTTYGCLTGGSALSPL